MLGRSSPRRPVTVTRQSPAVTGPRPANAPWTASILLCWPGAVSTGGGLRLLGSAPPRRLRRTVSGRSAGAAGAAASCGARSLPRWWPAWAHPPSPPPPRPAAGPAPGAGVRPFPRPWPSRLACPPRPPGPCRAVPRWLRLVLVGGSGWAFGGSPPSPASQIHGSYHTAETPQRHQQPTAPTRLTPNHNPHTDNVPAPAFPARAPAAPRPSGVSRGARAPALPLKKE